MRHALGCLLILAPVLVAAPAPAARHPRPADRALAAEVVLTATPSSVATLGGATNTAVDVSGDIVVGTSRTSARERHAYAVDLASLGSPLDLGTLGGALSVATAVDDTVVVGDSATAAGERHAFVYDLATPGRGMVDLGDLGSRHRTSSRALAVDGPRVVGWARNRTDDKRVFVYNVNLRRMKDLARPKDVGRVITVDVDGRHVVVTTQRRQSEYHGFRYDLADPGWVEVEGPGSSDTAWQMDDGIIAGHWGGSLMFHGYYYDVRAPRPSVVDLGLLPGCDVLTVLGTGDGVVHGRAGCGNGLLHEAPGFAYDVRARPGVLRDLGTLGDGRIDTTDAADGVVVGTAHTGAGRRAFAFDVRAPDAGLVDLGDLGGLEAVARAIDGLTVVGSSKTSAGVRQATVWTLAETEGPTVSFAEQLVHISEQAGAAEVEVVRTGAVDVEATVGFTTVALVHSAAQPGVDYVETEGTAVFAAGSSTATVEVPVIDDQVSEGRQTFGMALRDPAGGLTLGTPMVTSVVIGQSDLVPDAAIGPDNGDRLGDDVYNGTGEGQTVRVPVPAGEPVEFEVLVQLDPAAAGSFQVGGLVTMRASAYPAGSDVRVRLLGCCDVTSQLHAAEGLPISYQPSVPPLLIVTVTPDSASVGSELSIDLTASTAGEGERKDVVRAVVDVVG